MWVVLLRLYVGYRGRSAHVNRWLAELFNACRSVDAVPFARLTRLDDVENMFRSSWFDPVELALVLLGDRVVGQGWAWSLSRGSRVSLCADPRLPGGMTEEVAELVLSWARYSFELRGVRGSTSIVAGYENSFVHRLLKKVLGGAPLIETSWGTLMVFQGLEQRRSLPGCYGIRQATRGDVRRIVEVVNKAFSVYSWFEPWTDEEVLEDMEKRQLLAYLAEDCHGSTVGYVDAEIYRSIGGSEIGYVRVLAVDPHHQRRQLGRNLLTVAVEELKLRGVWKVVLDSVAGLEAFYRKQGFSEYRRLSALEVSISSLPQSMPTIESGQNLVTRLPT